MQFKQLALTAALATTVCVSAQAQTEIQWWHSMTAVNNEWVNDLAKQFNESQKDVLSGMANEALLKSHAAGDWMLLGNTCLRVSRAAPVFKIQCWFSPTTMSWLRLASAYNRKWPMS